jgi:hypothetical protein
MLETLLSIVVAIAAGQTALIVDISRRVGNIEGQITQITETLTHKKDKHI